MIIHLQLTDDMNILACAYYDIVFCRWWFQNLYIRFFKLLTFSKTASFKAGPHHIGQGLSPKWHTLIHSNWLYTFYKIIWSSNIGVQALIILHKERCYNRWVHEVSNIPHPCFFMKKSCMTLGIWSALNVGQFSVWQNKKNDRIVPQASKFGQTLHLWQENNKPYKATSTWITNTLTEEQQKIQCCANRPQAIRVQKEAEAVYRQ